MKCEMHTCSKRYFNINANTLMGVHTLLCNRPILFRETQEGGETMHNLSKCKKNDNFKVTRTGYIIYLFSNIRCYFGQAVTLCFVGIVCLSATIISYNSGL